MEYVKSALLGSGADRMKRAPSMDDFSLGAGRDAQEQYSEEQQGPATLEGAKKSLGDAVREAAGEGAAPESPSRKPNVWASTFNPGRNMSESYKSNVNSNYFDLCHDKTGEPTVWDLVLKGERLRIFQSFDRDNDGFIDAGDLMWRLGNTEEVKQLIAAADKNGDGKLDYAEFVELLRNS